MNQEPCPETAVEDDDELLIQSLESLAAQRCAMEQQYEELIKQTELLEARCIRREIAKREKELLSQVDWVSLSANDSPSATVLPADRRPETFPVSMAETADARSARFAARARMLQAVENHYNLSDFFIFRDVSRPCTWMVHTLLSVYRICDDYSAAGLSGSDVGSVGAAPANQREFSQEDILFLDLNPQTRTVRTAVRPLGEVQIIKLSSAAEARQLYELLCFLRVDVPVWQPSDSLSSSVPISIMLGTWNVGGAPIPPVLDGWVPNISSKQFDIYVLAFQECGMVDKKIPVNESIDRHFAIGRRPDYVTLVSESMWELRLFVVVRRSLVRMIRNLRVDTKATGKFQIFGNKGGIGCAFDLLETRLCFVSAHLAARTERVVERNNMLRQMLETLKLSSSPTDVCSSAEHVFVLGDLNYRTQIDSYDAVVQFCAQGRYDVIRKRDQLTAERRANRALSAFKEGDINFEPTYRYNRGELTFSREKLRHPSYCDRVLFSGTSSLQSYRCCKTMLTSDHLAVAADFVVPMRPAFLSFLAPSKVAHSIGMYAVKILPFPAFPVDSLWEQIDSARIRLDAPFLDSPLYSEVTRRGVGLGATVGASSDQPSGELVVTAPNPGAAASCAAATAAATWIALGAGAASGSNASAASPIFRWSDLQIPVIRPFMSSYDYLMACMLTVSVLCSDEFIGGLQVPLSLLRNAASGAMVAVELPIIRAGIMVGLLACMLSVDAREMAAATTGCNGSSSNNAASVVAGSSPLSNGTAGAGLATPLSFAGSSGRTMSLVDSPYASSPVAVPLPSSVLMLSAGSIRANSLNYSNSPLSAFFNHVYSNSGSGIQSPTSNGSNSNMNNSSSSNNNNSNGNSNSNSNSNGGGNGGGNEASPVLRNRGLSVAVQSAEQIANKSMAYRVGYRLLNALENRDEKRVNAVAVLVPYVMDALGRSSSESTASLDAVIEDWLRFSARTGQLDLLLSFGSNAHLVLDCIGHMDVVAQHRAAARSATAGLLGGAK